MSFLSERNSFFEQKNFMAVSAFLLLIGLLINLFARLFWNYPYCIGDEARYNEIVQRLDSGQIWPVSGPGYTWIMRSIHSLFDVPYEHISTFLGTSLSTAYLPILYFFFSKALHNNKLALLSTLALLLTSYFLAPMLESRPQQLGMLLVLFATYLLYKSTIKPRRYLMAVPFAILLLFYHLLSFGIFVCIAGLFWFEQYAGKSNRHLLVLYTAGLIGLLVSLFLASQGPYAVMFNDIRYNHLPQVSFEEASKVITIAVTIIIAGLLFFSVFNKIRDFLLSLSLRNYLFAFLALLFTAFLIQIYFLPENYLRVYSSSITNLLLLHSGNLFFLVFFIIGYWELPNYLEHNNISKDILFFKQLVSIVMFVGICFLFLSVFTPNKNWMLRVINYWTLFAAPIAAIGLCKVTRENWYYIVIPLPFILYTSLAQATIMPSFRSCG